MARLIDADKLESDMYHNAFEIDSDLQKWDSGCWIRYKMFENVIDEQPTVEAIPIEWLKRYAKSADDSVDCYWHFWAEDLLKMIDEWEAENEKAD